MERTGFEQWKPREVARLLALVETERRYYQEMVAALPVALVVLAPDRTIVSANAAFRRLAGLSGEELRKRSIEQVLPSNELIERIRAVHVHGDAAPFAINVPFSILTGERRVRITAVAIRSWEDEMEPETLLLVQLETTQLETAPAEATQPEIIQPESVPPAAPAAVLDLAALPAIVWQADASTFAFTYASGAVEEILKYPAAHWLSEPLFFSERIHPDDRTEVMALYRSVAASGGEASAEYRALPASGVEVWCRESIRVPAPGTGERRIAGIMSPIGKRRQLEAQSLAAARIEALRVLSSRLAHDLNNPLMIVTGYTEELLAALPEDDPMSGDLKEVLAAGGKLTEVAGQLLGFTRPLAKAPSKIDLSKLIATLEQRLREMVGASIRGTAADIEFGCPDGSAWALADAEQLDQAITALATFAIENTKGVSWLGVMCGASHIVELVGTATLKPGVYARLDIQVSGEGTSDPAVVFESILVAKDARKPAGPAVARAYLNVRQWGGDIVFSSSAAQGSAFAVYLPYVEPPSVVPEEAAPAQEAPEMAESAAASPEPPAEPLPPEPPPPEPPPPEPSLGTVLVVEDEPGIRGLVRKILKREHYQVLEAGSGEEALEAAAAHGAGIGLLLTDVMLPGISGRELAESLVAAQADLKVIYISGFTDDESVRVGQFPPGSMFLQKPFTLSSLVGVVKQAFEL